MTGERLKEIVTTAELHGSSWPSIKKHIPELVREIRKYQDEFARIDWEGLNELDNLRDEIHRLQSENVQLASLVESHEAVLRSFTSDKLLP